MLLRLLGLLQSFRRRRRPPWSLFRHRPTLGDTTTSHAFFIPPSSEFGRGDVVISYHGRSFGLIVISGARLGVASERISHGWVNWSSSERVGMRHESVSNLSFSNSDLSSFGEEESSIPVSSSAEVGLRWWKAKSVGLVQLEYFGRSYWNGYVRCDPGVGQTPNDEMTEWNGLTEPTVDESN